MGIEFTQYLRPNGRRSTVSIEREDATEHEARFFIDKGGRFECEELMTGHVSLTAVFPTEEGDEDIAIEVVSNGPAVPTAVDQLVTSAVRWLNGRAA